MRHFRGLFGNRPNDQFVPPKFIDRIQNEFNNRTGNRISQRPSYRISDPFSNLEKQLRTWDGRRLTALGDASSETARRIRGEGPRELTALILALALVVGASETAAGSASASDFDDPLPSWLPSLAVGLGATIRKTEGNINGRVATSTSSAITANCNNNRVCRFGQEGDFNDFTVSLMDVSVNGQLLGPSWTSAPLKPRPMIQAGVAFPLTDSRLVTGLGSKVSDFNSNSTEPDVRLELRSETDYNWFIGLGTALELPLDLPPEKRVWLKLGLNYSEERLNSVASIIQKVDIDTVPGGKPIPINETVTSEEELTIRSIGPMLGIEALVYQVGPISVGFGADFMVMFAPDSFNDGGVESNIVVEAPGFLDPPNPGEVNYTMIPDDIQYQAMVTMRFTWTGGM